MRKKLEEELHAFMSSGDRSSSRTSDPNHSSSKPPKPGHCHVRGCGAKVKGYTSQNGWKLCSTCLLKVRSSGKPLTLYDGSQWGKTGKAHRAYNKNNACSMLGTMRARGVQGIPSSNDAEKKALAAKKAKRNQPDADPESPGGQDGNAALDDDAEPFGEGVERMVTSLKAKADKSAKSSAKKRKTSSQ